MTPEHEACVNDFVTRCFRDTADTDYISARACYRIGLIDQFLWLGTQAIEKYLKGILVLYERNTKKIGHNLTKAITKVESIPDIPWDFSSELKEFLEHLTTYGNNRYFVIPRIRKGRELFQMDDAVWSVRRYCQCLSYTHEWESQIPDKSFFETYVTGLASPECRKAPHAFRLLVKGYLEEVVLTDKYPEQRGHLVWKNLYYGRCRKRVVCYRKVESFSQPAHFVHPEVFEWLSTKVDFYKEVREHFKEGCQQRTVEYFSTPGGLKRL